MESGNAVVFIIDDDASIRTALKRLIQSIGLVAETFDTAQAFLEYASREASRAHPACLVLDVRMPGISGIELQKQLTAANIHLPVIFITGHGSIPMSVNAMKAGAVDFIEKPFEDQQLLDAIHSAIAKNRQYQAEQAEISKIQARANSLTPRELEVFVLVVSGMLNKQIAFELGLSEKTIKIHRARVMQKMKAQSLADLVRMFEKSGSSKTIPPSL